MPTKSDMQVGSASIKIVVDKKGLKDGIDSGKKGLTDLAGVAEKEMGKFKAAFITAAGAAVVAVGAAMKEIAGHTIDVSAEFERLEVKLNALTKGRGKETLDELNEWAMVMPVNTMKAVDTFSMMMAMGLNPTIDKMTTLVDVSVLFGEEAMPIVARALGQMKSLGKLSAEELNQLSEAGINARKYLNEAFGMSVEELQKSGKDIDEIIQAIMDGLKNEFGGAAAEAQKTWTGVKESFVSTLDEIARKGGESEGSFDGLKEAVRGLTKNISDNEDTFIKLAGNTVKIASNLVYMAGVITDKAAPAIDVLNKALWGLETTFGWLGIHFGADGGLPVDMLDVQNMKTDPEAVLGRAKITKLKEEITGLQETIKNPTVFKIFKGEEEFLRVSDKIQKKQQDLSKETTNLQKHISDKAIADDFDFFTGEMKKAQNNLDDLSRMFQNSPSSDPGAGSKGEVKPSAASKKNINVNAYADTMKELALHYREINDEISEQERALTAVDSIVDSHVDDLRDVGMAEKEISKIRAESHKRVLDIVKGQEELKKVVESVKKLEEDGKIYGDDYRTLEDGIASQFGTYKELMEEAEKRNQEIAEDIGGSFADAFLTGFEDGIDGLGDVLKRVLEDQVFNYLSTSVSNAVQESVSKSKALQQYGPAMGAMAGVAVGAVAGFAVNSLMNKGGADPELEAQRKLIRELKQNTEATDRNTERLLSGDTSSYSGGFWDLSDGLQQAAQGLNDSLSLSIKGMSGAFNPKSWGPWIEQLVKLGDFKTMLDDIDIGASGLQEALKTFKGLRDMGGIHEKTAAGLDNIIATLEEFAANIDAVQKDIIKTARDAWEGAGDAFRTEGEIQRRDMEKSGRDLLLGLAESFQMEGVVAPDYAGELSKLGSVQEISQKLLADLTPGTEAYNQALEASLVIYETARLKQQEAQTEILTSVRGMWESANEALLSDSERAQKELEKQGKEWLVGLADTYGVDTGSLSKLGNVSEISKKLLNDLVPGTEEYNQVMEASILIYETAVLRQKNLTQTLDSSVADWRGEMERKKWGLSEWSDEFETIGQSIEGLNVLSDSYFTDAVELAEKQFDALKQIASFSEAQLAELKSSSRSLADQLWDITKGGSADTMGVDDWMKRGESLYRQAERTLSAEDISAFQSYVPELRDAMLASGHSASYVNNQLEWALSALLEKVNQSMSNLSSTIDKLPGLAPALQPIQISLNIDGKVLSNVLIDQLNTNATLVNAVRKVVN